MKKLPLLVASSIALLILSSCAKTPQNRHTGVESPNADLLSGKWRISPNLVTIAKYSSPRHLAILYSSASPGKEPVEIYVDGNRLSGPLNSTLRPKSKSIVYGKTFELKGTLSGNQLGSYATDITPIDWSVPLPWCTQGNPSYPLSANTTIISLKNKRFVRLNFDILNGREDPTSEIYLSPYLQIYTEDGLLKNSLGKNVLIPHQGSIDFEAKSVVLGFFLQQKEKSIKSFQFAERINFP